MAALQDEIRELPSDSCGTKLAQEGLVLVHTLASGRLPSASPGSHRPSVLWPGMPSCFLVAGFGNLAVETQVLRGRGL